MVRFDGGCNASLLNEILQAITNQPIVKASLDKSVFFCRQVNFLFSGFLIRHISTRSYANLISVIFFTESFFFSLRPPILSNSASK